MLLYLFCARLATRVVALFCIFACLADSRSFPPYALPASMRFNALSASRVLCTIVDVFTPSLLLSRLPCPVDHHAPVSSLSNVVYVLLSELICFCSRDLSHSLTLFRLVHSFCSLVSFFLPLPPLYVPIGLPLRIYPFFLYVPSLLVYPAYSFSCCLPLFFQIRVRDLPVFLCLSSHGSLHPAHSSQLICDCVVFLHFEPLPLSCAPGHLL